tara:strand:- start:1088 stop:1204 length:117 start_codon:yes stop_codon:yes gene_type:complete
MEELYRDTLDLRDGCIRRDFNKESQYNEYYMQEDVLNL